MARTKESSVSWLRRLAGTLEQVIETVEEQGGTFSDLRSFLSNPGNRCNLGMLVMGTLELAKPTQYPVTVDYSKTLAEMIAAGEYDWVNEDITADHFPINGEGTVEMEVQLVHLNRVASIDEVLAHLEVNGLRPATLAELLAFGAANPNVQREFSVVALGSSWVCHLNSRNVPYLGSLGSLRNLALHWLDYPGLVFCRFLAVRK